MKLKKPISKALMSLFVVLLMCSSVFCSFASYEGDIGRAADDEITDYTQKQINRAQNNRYSSEEYYKRLYALGENNGIYVVAVLNSDFTQVDIYKNNSESDGVMKDFNSSSNQLLIDHASTIKRAVVHKGVKNIGAWLFENADKLTDVILPDSINSIGTGAFYKSGLFASFDGVTWPSDLTGIGNYAFSFTASFGPNANVVIPDTVTTLGSRAFDSCAFVKSVSFGKNTKLTDDWFSSGYNTEVINVADSNPYYTADDGVLYNKNKSILIKCPPSKKFTGKYVVPNTVTEIAMEAFANSSIKEIDLSESLSKLGAAAFKETDLREIALPNALKTISKYTFMNCTNLTNVKVGNETVKIADDAFFGCPNLTEITLPKTISEISTKALGFYKSGGKTVKSTDFTVYGYTYSAAENYAAENNFKFISIGENPIVNTDTLQLINGEWCYVVNGKIDRAYTGLVKFKDVWYYVSSGVLDRNYTGLTNYYGTWYYVNGGILDWNYIGLTNYYGTWYYVNGGILDWNYTGLTNYYGTWYYVDGGILDWNYIGLTNYYGTWYYVNGGILDWNYTGLTNYYGTWYYVGGGILDWNYTGFTNYYGTWYYVQNGIMI